MKPYKILKPNKSLWQNAILEVSITEKKIIKLPLKLITECHSLPKDRHIAENIKVIYEQESN